MEKILGGHFSLHRTALVQRVACDRRSIPGSDLIPSMFGVIGGRPCRHWWTRENETNITKHLYRGSPKERVAVFSLAGLNVPSFDLDLCVW
jgi:hypothetical protein